MRIVKKPAVKAPPRKPRKVPPPQKKRASPQDAQLPQRPLGWEILRPVQTWWP